MLAVTLRFLFGAMFVMILGVWATISTERVGVLVAGAAIGAGVAGTLSARYGARFWEGRAIAFLTLVLVATGCAPLGQRPTFPTVPARFSMPELASRTTTLYSPEGPGPFPAVVLLHACAGVKRSTVWYWAGRLTTAGYAVLVVDSFGPRGTESVCGTGAVTVDEVADDAFAALAHLRTLPFIDRDRIAVVGFSWERWLG